MRTSDKHLDAASDMCRHASYLLSSTQAEGCRRQGARLLNLHCCFDQTKVAVHFGH